MNILAKESCLSDCKITEFILIQRTLSSGNNQKGPDIFMSDPHQNLFRYSILSSVIPIATFGVQSLHPLPDCCMESIILHFVSHLVKLLTYKISGIIMSILIAFTITEFLHKRCWCVSQMQRHRRLPDRSTSAIAAAIALYAELDLAEVAR